MTDPVGDDFDALRLPLAALTPRPEFAVELRVHVHRRLRLPDPPGHRAMQKVAGLEYEIGGNPDGEAVLLMHAGTATAYRPLMTEPALVDHHRLVRYHRRGYAGSDRFEGDASIDGHVADALALLDHLAVERAHIVGHSGSGIIALQLALDAPDRTRSLVLEEPALTPSDPRWGAVMREGIGIAVDRYRAGDARGAIEMWMREISLTWRADLTRTVPGGPQQTIEDAPAFFDDVPPVLEWVLDEDAVARISVPVLYLLADNSRPANRDVMRRFLALVPQTEAAVVPDTTHMLHTDQPALVAVALASFLARHRH